MHIQPYADNAKKHPKKQIEQIAESIKRFGMNQPIVVDEKGIIIVGHGRYAALQHLGWELKPEWILQLKNLTEAEVNAYRLADNKLNESDWDMDLVLEELHGLADAELQRLTGFDMDLLIEATPEDDEVPDVPEEPRSKLGDLYQLGNHRVLCGSATDVKDMERLFDGRKADMWLTDPPYNVNYESKAGKIENDNMVDDEFREFLVAAYRTADEFMKPGAVFYIWHADSEGYNFRGAAKDIGWTIRQCLIWKKSSLVMGRQDYHWQHEPCLYGWKDGTHLWAADRKQTTILEFDKPTNNDVHPTMKPVELMAYQITNNTKQEDIVLDSFLGSGSTLIAAEKTGRICYGTELDPKFVDVIVQRYVDYVPGAIVKLDGKEIEWSKSK
jgi:site-specific DNA-methyltransferase (adenine-specific)